MHIKLYSKNETQNLTKKNPYTYKRIDDQMPVYYKYCTTLLIIFYGHKPFYGEATSCATANGSANSIP